MNKNNLIYIANWKMYFTHNQALAWIKNHRQALNTLGHTASIVICPSFDALASVGHALKDTGIALGAQDCSAHNPGAYTGQILATSLKEIGCTYCIIGHSEVLKEYKETHETIAKKAELLLELGIIPIICVGESAQEYEQELGVQIIEQQLAPILKTIKSQATRKSIGVAYEPLWVIGTDSIPPAAYLISQLETIKRLCSNYIPDTKALLLYGGNVNEWTIKPFKDTPLLDGVLIGSASTDFQKFQKIVLS